jgi:hypothetical protein
VRQNRRVHQSRVIYLVQSYNIIQGNGADGCQSTVDGRIGSQCRDRRGCGGRQAKISH